MHTDLSPILEEVLAEDIFSGVLMVQHFGKEPSSLFCFGGEGHYFTTVSENNTQR